MASSKYLSVGILAHVDSGKTTLIESMLYQSRTIRKQGRVDHQDSFLDYDDQERSRGITIYSKQAVVKWKDQTLTFVDTPGHVDFSAEMERVLSVLDMAVLLISGSEKVQSHTKTIWKCLRHYGIPTLVYVNKMDLDRFSKEELLSNIHQELDDAILETDNFESLALLDESLLNEYLETETIQKEHLKPYFEQEKYFPVYFGSALKNDGVNELLEGLSFFAPGKEWPQEFGARVFKITRDENNNRITHMRITGGSLKVKDQLQDGEKADQIRVYSGAGYQAVSEAEAGMIVSVKGLEKTQTGQGLGFEKDLQEPVLEPCLRYDLVLPAHVDPVVMMSWCKILNMEDPSLDITFSSEKQVISLSLMGAVQQEILQKRLKELSGETVGFTAGSIVYKETIAEPVYGYGHFEPLRHYAEVHLLLEPLKRGSGLIFASRVSRDVLSLNWQRLVLTHLQEREHKGVLTRSAITDMKITLIAGRAHNKHTEGGDFRQATYRAIRQGLMNAENILLEPFYKFSLEVPSSVLSKVLYDLELKKASVSVESEGTKAIITGRGPVRTLMNYQSEAAAITSGTGVFSFEMDGYDVCPDSDAVIDEIGYNPLADPANPCGSVFCEHGSGTYVEFDEVEERLHIPPVSAGLSSSSIQISSGKVSNEQMKAAFEAAGGRNTNLKKKAMEQAGSRQKRNRSSSFRQDLDLSSSPVTLSPSLPQLLIVDGYNMIYAWDSLKDLAKTSLSCAREELISDLINYAGYRNCSLMIVFDGYKRNDANGNSQNRGNASIIYTRSGQSADAFIEKKVHDLKNKFRITVATSDGLIQNSILASGAVRVSARELENKVRSINAEAFSAYQNKS